MKRFAFTFLAMGICCVISGQSIIAPLDIWASRPDLQDRPVVPIKKIARHDIIHRFHDTSPLSPSGRFMALFRMPFGERYPVPGEYGEVILVDMESGTEKVVGRSFGWEIQLGANVQWGKDDHELFYNNVDTTTWKPYVVRYDAVSGRQTRIDGTIFMNSMDGKKLASHNLINSVHAQSGYGVLIPDSLTQYNVGPVSTDGIFVTDVETNETTRIATIKDIYEKSVPSIKIPNPEDYSYYCFKAMWNPQGTRLMTCLLYKAFAGGKRKVLVITMKPDGSDIRTAITAEQYAKGGHHMAWLPDGEHISINLEVDDSSPGLEIVTVKYDGTDLKKVYHLGSGHPSFHPGGLPYIITDAYSKETTVTKGDGFVPIRLINTETKKETILAWLFVPNVEDSSFRVDAHPTWDRSGRYVIFNGYGDGTRCVYMADLTKILYPGNVH